MRAWLKLHPLTVVFVGLLLVFGVPIVIVLNMSYQANQKVASSQEVLDEQNVKFVQYQVDQKLEGCKSSNRSRSAIQKILDDSSSGGKTATIDFASIPGFRELSAETQFFLGNLQAFLAQPGSVSIQDIADDYRLTNPANQDCEQIASNLEEKLSEP